MSSEPRSHLMRITDRFGQVVLEAPIIVEDLELARAQFDDWWPDFLQSGVSLRWSQVTGFCEATRRGQTEELDFGVGMAGIRIPATIRDPDTVERMWRQLFGELVSRILGTTYEMIRVALWPEEAPPPPPGGYVGLNLQEHGQVRMPGPGDVGPPR